MRRNPDAPSGMPPVRPRRRAAIRAAAVATVLLLGAGTATGVGAQTASAAPVPALACDQNTIYGLGSDHALTAIDVRTAAATSSGVVMGSNTNGLGVSPGGTHAYAYGDTSSAYPLADYDVAHGTVSTVPSLDAHGTVAIRGAVNPVNGVFYYAASTIAAASGSTQGTTYVGAYDPATGTRYSQVAAVRTATFGSGGDMAFSKSGVLYLLTGNTVYRVDGTVPAASGTGVLQSTLVTRITGVTSSPGLAFAANGYLYATNSANLIRIDPVTGVSATVGAMGYTPSDLAGCNNPDSIASSVSVTSRVHASDQWTVSLASSGANTWSSASRTATTSGSATGRQAQGAGPVLALGGSTYTATQTLAAGSASTAADYDTTWSCEYTDDAGTATVLSHGTGGTATATPPTGPTPNGMEVDCAFTNTPAAVPAPSSPASPATSPVGLGVALAGPRIDPSDQFVLETRLLTASGAVAGSTTTTGSGSSFSGGSASTGPVRVPSGQQVVLTARTAAGAATAFSHYATTLTCTDTTGTMTGLPSHAAFTGSYPLTPDAGSTLDCTLTATPRTASLTVTAGFGTARIDDGDQLTIGVQDAGGAALAPASTTAGTGTSTTAGTGTSGPLTVLGDDALTITGSAAPHDAQYALALTCTDAHGATQGLPSGAAFTGSAAITPATGDAIECTVTARPRTASFTASTALGGARVDDGDQFAVVVRDAGGAVLAGPATTTGTGTALSGGAAAAVSVAGGAVVTIVQQPTGHTSRYARTLTCSDPTGFTQGLPSGAPFTGSATVVTAAGAAISCAVDTRPANASLTLSITGPASLTAGRVAEYALTVGNDGGTGAAPTVAQRLPAGAAYTGVTGTGWSCTASGAVAAGQLVTCSGPTVPAAGDRAFVLRVTPTPEAAGTDAVLPAAVDTTGGSSPAAPASCLGGAAPAGCAVAASLHVADGIALTTAVTPPAAFLPGVAAQYEVVVTNTGTGTAASATVTQRLPDGVDYVGATGATCTVAGRVVTCTVPGPIGAGGVVRAVIDVLPAAAVPAPSTAPSPATPVLVADPTRGLALAVAVRGGAAMLAVGDAVRYAYTVTNTGSTALSGVVLSDGTACASTSLAAGAATACVSAPHRVTQAEVDAGGFARTATASAVVAGCTAGCAITSNEVRAASLTRTVGALGLAQSVRLRDADGDRRAGAGETVVFRAVVTSTGTATVTGLKVRGGLGRYACPTTTLAPGASVTCTLEHVVQARDLAGGVLSDTAVATAKGVSVGKVVSAHRTAAVTAAQLPAALASTGLDLAAPLGAALALLLLAGIGVLLLRRRALRLRRP